MIEKYHWIPSDSLGANGKGVYSSSWNCTGSLIGATTTKNSVKLSLFDLEAFQTVSLGKKSSSLFFSSFQELENHYSHLCWHPFVEERLALAGEPKTIELWDAKCPSPSARLQTSGNNINICFSPDGNYLAVGNRSDVLQVFDLRTNSLLSKKRFSYEVNQFSFTANSDHIITANASSASGGIDLLALNIKSQPTEDTQASLSTEAAGASSETSLEFITHLCAHSSNCFTLKIDSTFSRMAIGSADLTLSLWDLEDLICTRHIQLEHDARGLSFNYDSTILSIASENGGILVVDSQDGHSLAQIQARCQKLTSANWHPKINMMSVSCSDKNQSQSSFRFLCFSDD